jgi:hypothetical protein
MTAPTGWPDKAREAAAFALCRDDAGCKICSVFADCGEQRLSLHQVDVMLTALAPFVAAALAQARRDALEEAAAYLDGRKAVYEARAIATVDDPAHLLTPGDTAAMIAGVLESAAAAIRAKAQEAGDE